MRRGRGLWWDEAVFGGVKMKMEKREMKTCFFDFFLPYIWCELQDI